MITTVTYYFSANINPVQSIVLLLYVGPLSCWVILHEVLVVHLLFWGFFVLFYDLSVSYRWIPVLSFSAVYSGPIFLYTL